MVLIHIRAVTLTKSSNIVLINNRDVTTIHPRYSYIAFYTKYEYVLLVHIRDVSLSQSSNFIMIHIMDVVLIYLRDVILTHSRTVVLIRIADDA